MNQAQAESLMAHYAAVARYFGYDEVITGIYDRYLDLPEPTIETAMLGVGFCQGYLVCKGAYTLDEVKNHASLAVAEVPPF